MKILIFCIVVLVAFGLGFLIQPIIYEQGERLRPTIKVVPVESTEQQTAKERILAKVPTVNINETNKLRDLLRTKNGEGQATEVTPPSEPGATEDEFDRKYPMPNFRTLEELTANWTTVPSRAFPRKVRTTVPVDFASGVGKTTVPAGSELVALAFNGGVMTLARAADSDLKATVTLASTNFKETLSAAYDSYVQKRRSDITKARENARYQKANPAPPPPPVDEQAKLAGARPVPDGQGRIPEMVQSISSKEVTEFKLGDIQSWGPVEFSLDKGKACWSCTIGVQISTMFGMVDTEVQAFISRGRVIKWIFAGSKEPVQ